MSFEAQNKCSHPIPLIWSVLFFWFGMLSLYSQPNTTKSKDTIAFYDNVKNISEKSKVTRWLYPLIFKRSSKSSEKRTMEVAKRFCECKDFHGKPIRRIFIQTLDPFGYSDIDTLEIPDKWIERAGNQLHYKTRNRIVQNLILFDKGQSYDSLLVMESERLLRTQRYIRSARIWSVDANTTNDSIDVYVRVLDSWSLIPNGSFSPSRSTVQFVERNTLGLGHETQYAWRRNLAEGLTAQKFRYTIPNIKNTYINAAAFYDRDLVGNFEKGMSLERIFFSPLTRWAGGTSLIRHHRPDSIQITNEIVSREMFKWTNFDSWVGRSFPLKKGSTVDERSTNILIKGRWLHRHYSNAPTAEIDSLGFFTNENLFLTSFGIASRRFYQDKFIFNYDIVEDVPMGKVYNMTIGMQRKNQTTRPYIGLQFGYGNKFSFGYASVFLDYGTFFNNGNSEQTAYVVQFNYFTNLLNIGNWRIRQFVSPQFVWGKRRLAFYADQVTLNEIDDGITGFQSFNSYGTQKFIVNLQTQTYSPWNLAGFRLNPFFAYAVGMIGNNQNLFSESRPYSKISFGFLINNDYLVFSNFQISFSFFPKIPGVGNNVFNSNSLNTQDFGLQDFDVGRPRLVRYN
jgi:hypothetical protein